MAPPASGVAAEADRLSVRLLGNRSVAVAPLHHESEVFGVLYLEYPTPLARLDAELKTFLAELSEMAGLFLARAVEREALRQHARQLERDLFAQYDFAGIVTRHPKMLEVLKVVAQVADAPSTILIRGETGMGKELIARALHVNSARRQMPFVTIHCSALPESILESELFGHVKGAFSGAERDRPGRIASGDGGTLLLDEVAEIPWTVQAKLLRFLQFGELQRLGSDRLEKVDVRILAATHQDLAGMVAQGSSAKTSSSAWGSSISPCRLCASAAATSPSCSITSFAVTGASRTSSRDGPCAPSARSATMTIQGTSASSPTSWSEHASSRPDRSSTWTSCHRRSPGPPASRARASSTSRTTSS
jgi:hypothetical protein